MNKDQLISVFRDAELTGAKHVAVKIQMGSLPDYEYIVNGSKNFTEKLKYYDKTYGEDLKHAHAPVAIVGAAYGDNFDQIQEQLEVSE